MGRQNGMSSSIGAAPPPPDSAGLRSPPPDGRPKLRDPFSSGKLSRASPPPREVEQLQLAAKALQHDLGRIAVIAALVLPFARLQLAFDVDLRALLAVLLGHLAEILVEDHDVVPLGALLALARVLVAPSLRSGEGEAYDLIAGVQPAHFRILAQIADEDHLVDAARHGLLLTRPCGAARSIMHSRKRRRRDARAPDNRTCPHFGAPGAWEAAPPRLH